MFQAADKVVFRGQTGFISRVPSEGFPYYAIQTEENWFLLDGTEIKRVSGVVSSRGPGEIFITSDSIGQFSEGT